jgi:uncharacterized membrane protein
MDKAKHISLFGIAFLFLIFSTMLFSHEGHHHESENQTSEQQAMVPTDYPQKEIGNEFDVNIIHRLGTFHPILLHFPIALIVMTAVSELLFCWYSSSLFEQASRFMIIAAAITAIPTALSGLAFGYNAHYEGIFFTLFWWHRLFGIFTVLLTIVASVLRELYLRKQRNTLRAYYLCLFIAFISVNLTGYLGGGMTFGPSNLWPPLDF